MFWGSVLTVLNGEPNTVLAASVRDSVWIPDNYLPTFRNFSLCIELLLCAESSLSL